MDYQDRFDEMGTDRRFGRTDGESTRGLAKHLLENAGELVRAEVELAKLEMRDYADHLTRNLIKGAVAAVFGLGALLAALHFVAQVLDVWMAEWLAYLLVAVLLGGAAAVLALRAKKGFQTHARPDRIAPRTIQTLQEDKAWLSREMRGEEPRTM